jgi:membrane protease YdiL (CAAX protease family)
MKQLFTFFGLSYGISWVLWLPLYGHLIGLPNLPIVAFQHALGGLGPLMASVLTTWMFHGNTGVKKIFKLCFRVRPFFLLLIAVFSPFILALTASLISYLIDQKPVDFSGILTAKEFPDFNLFSFFIYNLIFFGFGEEAGWRGFALPRLQAKFNALSASIILTFLWALWHWPLFFYRPSYMDMGLSGVAGWLFSLLTGSILLTWFYNSSNGSILICAIFHSTVDIAFTADFSDKNIMNYMGMLITLWGIITIIIFRPANLAFTTREMLSTRQDSQ